MFDISAVLYNDGIFDPQERLVVASMVVECTAPQNSCVRRHTHLGALLNLIGRDAY
jgi:hypothetical protein